ncbi:MAG TPA: hypothetical protein VK190_05695 [Pseudoneobacillus sp.]|nr:hypothetical protein [Pseudoneobacillus sp.]
MELIKDLERFLGERIEVAIHDIETKMQPPWVEKKIKKLELCPDGTHLRIYFDTFYFFAVPLNSTISQSDLDWSALDSESGLYYLIRKVK